MIRYIVKHRRKTSSEWDVIGRENIEDGEFAIEYNDDYTMARILIGGKNGIDALEFNPISKIRTVSLPLSAWAGENNLWFQVVTIDGVTANSKIDLQPTASQLASLQNSETSLIAENNEGIVTIYAIGELPIEDFKLQITLTETSD